MKDVKRVQARERLAAGEAPGEVARALGVSRATIYRWAREGAPSLQALRTALREVVTLAERALGALDTESHVTPRSAPKELPLRAPFPTVWGAQEPIFEFYAYQDYPEGLDPEDVTPAHVQFALDRVKAQAESAHEAGHLPDLLLERLRNGTHAHWAEAWHEDRFLGWVGDAGEDEVFLYGATEAAREVLGERLVGTGTPSEERATPYPPGEAHPLAEGWLDLTEETKFYGC